jgi:predicted dehydrogenase
MMQMRLDRQMETFSGKKLKVAVVGLGKMGLLHTSILSVFDEVELLAVCDKSTLMSMLYKKIFSHNGVRVLGDFEKLSELNPDAVYVTTPISSHYFILKTLLSKGITHNIFVEKTLAFNYNQAKELCKLAKTSGGITMVGYMKRFSVVFRKAKELLSQNVLGKPYLFKAYAYSSDFLGLTKKSRSSAHRGGALKDSGSHVVDLALWLLGDLGVSDVLSCVKTGVGSETSVSFTVLNSTGLEGQFDISQHMPNYRMPEFGLTIECPKGRIEVNDDRLLLTLADGDQRKWYKQDLNDNVFFYLGESEYFREDKQFIRSLSKREACESDFEAAAKVDFILSKVQEKEC